MLFESLATSAGADCHVSPLCPREPPPALAPSCPCCHCSCPCLPPLILSLLPFLSFFFLCRLEEITVTEVESQNYYHFHDNRVLPSHVDEALANSEGGRAQGCVCVYGCTGLQACVGVGAGVLEVCARTVCAGVVLVLLAGALQPQQWAGRPGGLQACAGKWRRCVEALPAQCITASSARALRFFLLAQSQPLPTAPLAAGWWYKPDFIINDLNVQSAIGYPAHEEVVPLAAGTYAVRGYAYCGESRVYSTPCVLTAQRPPGCRTSTDWRFQPAVCHPGHALGALLLHARLCIPPCASFPCRQGNKSLLPLQATATRSFGARFRWTTARAGGWAL